MDVQMVFPRPAGRTDASARQGDLPVADEPFSTALDSARRAGTAEETVESDETPVAGEQVQQADAPTGTPRKDVSGEAEAKQPDAAGAVEAPKVSQGAVPGAAEGDEVDEDAVEEPEKAVIRPSSGRKDAQPRAGAPDDADESEEAHETTDRSIPRAQTTSSSAARDAGRQGNPRGGETSAVAEAEDQPEAESDASPRPSTRGQYPAPADEPQRSTEAGAARPTMEDSSPPGGRSAGATVMAARPDGVEASGERPAMQPAQASRPAVSAPAPTAASDAQLAETNLNRIVTSVRGALLPNGGTMQIRLDPPELGTLQVSVRMIDGAMTATLQTTNDAATQLVSHNLQQLRQSLESQGVTIERLNVQQTSREASTSTNAEDSQHQDNPQDSSARQEQQRRELLQRMWRKLAMGEDPLDLVA